jgi:hypothetical protein
MALRTSSLSSSPAAPLAATEWRARVQQAVAGAGAAVAAGDLDRLATAFAELAEPALSRSTSPSNSIFHKLPKVR